MAQTVIGIFDNESEAQSAIQQLVSNGFSRSSIDLSSGNASTTSTAKKHDDDSIGGFFKSLFGSDDNDADKYTTVGRRSCIVTVHAQSSAESERAADILDDFGAVDVNERASQYGSNFTGTSTDTYNRAATTDAGTSIPIIEENLQVGKRVVETGGVRLRSRIIERPVEESLRLREEHVHIERNPVNRPASEADLAGFQQGTIEMTEHAEVPIVNKEARVVEEVTLNKDVTEREETIRDTVRRTDVDVENLRTDNTTTTRYDSDNRTLDSDDLNRPSGL